MTPKRKTVKALLWLIAKCCKYGEFRTEDYYDYTTRELHMSRTSAHDLVDVLAEEGLAEKEKAQGHTVECARLCERVKWLMERV